MNLFLHRAAVRACALVFVACAWLPLSAAADFPEKPLQMVSPFAAGGTNDYLTRLMAQQMGAVLKVNIVVENRTGANGIVGASYMAKAAPDGYVLLMGNSATHGTNPTLYPDQPYDSSRDFAPVSMVGSVPIILIANTALGFSSVADIVAYGKANPGKLAFGSSGVGGTGHLCGEALKAAAGIDMVHAPYKGDAPAVTDAMGGQVAMAFVGIASALTQSQSGRIRIIAIAHPRRVASLSSVPTLAEAGYKGLEFSQWYALFARGGTPRATIDKLNAAAKAVLEREDMQKGMATQGAEPAYSTPEDLAAFFRAEIQRFGEIIQRLNIKAG